jgi:hypothetical protein
MESQRPNSWTRAVAARDSAVICGGHWFRLWSPTARCGALPPRMLTFIGDAHGVKSGYFEREYRCELGRLSPSCRRTTTRHCDRQSTFRRAQPPVGRSQPEWVRSPKAHPSKKIEDELFHHASNRAASADHLGYFRAGRSVHAWACAAASFLTWQLRSPCLR